MKEKILVVLGPTATGKSALAVKLAKKFNGEVISADSRQVYKGMDLGSGKITKKEMKGVPHHLLDVASPKRVFNVENFKSLVETKIQEITSRKKLPIICGGTGFYIQSVIDKVVLPNVPPNPKLRKILGEKTPEELLEMIKKLDPHRAKELDPKNKVRLIRAIEIAKVLGKVPKIKKSSPYNVLPIGIDLPDQILKKNISIRLFSRLPKSFALGNGGQARISRGMVSEVQNLHKSGVSWKRLEGFGLEYRFIAQFLQNKISQEEMCKYIEKETWQYVKRQRTWFRKDKRIKWFSPKNKKILAEIKSFLD